MEQDDSSEDNAIRSLNTLEPSVLPPATANATILAAIPLSGIDAIATETSSTVDAENQNSNEPMEGQHVLPIAVEEETYESLQSETESEAMQDAESQPELEARSQEIGQRIEVGDNDNARFDEDEDSFAHSIMQILEIPEEEAALIQRVEQQDEAVGRMLEDSGDLDSDSSDIVFEGDEPPVRNGNWEIPAVHVRAAIRELYEQGQRGESLGNSVGDLLNRDRFMQRMRRLVFGQELFRRRNRGAVERSRLGQDQEDIGDSSENGPRDNEQDSREEEEEPENPIRFDTNLAAEHSYLGSNMSRVSGVNYLEDGQQYTLLLFMHQHVLFPGEVLPFMISESVIGPGLDDENGLLFGVCFPFICDQPSEAINLYGVTCQIYEKGTDARGNVLIKSRALQRFVVKTTSLASSPPFITGWAQRKVFGLVKILPEIYLPEPLQCVDMGSMFRFRDDASMTDMYRRFQAASTPWPVCIYNSYNMSRIVEKARTQLAAHKIDTMPTDPVQLSFWLVRNLHLSENMTQTIFTTDSVNMRMKLIESTFKQDATFTCRYCGNSIANCSELFAMSKHGVQTQYCNSAGYIHEINTVYQLLRDAIRHSGEPSAEFSWFPGYQWHIIICKICARHIGWEFKALEPNLVPKGFFGISRSTVRISTRVQDPPDVIYRNFMRLARHDMQ